MGSPLLSKGSGKRLVSCLPKHSSGVHPNIRILQPMFSLFFWFHWSELEMRRQQSTKPSNVWFFQKISRSNLCLTDPWQLQISLFLSLLALHLVEKLSDSHLCQAAQVFIMCIHTEYPVYCTPQRHAVCSLLINRLKIVTKNISM